MSGIILPPGAVKAVPRVSVRSNLPELKKKYGINELLPISAQICEASNRPGCPWTMMEMIEEFKPQHCIHRGQGRAIMVFADNSCIEFDIQPDPSGFPLTMYAHGPHALQQVLDQGGYTGRLPKEPKIIELASHVGLAGKRERQ